MNVFDVNFENDGNVSGMGFVIEGNQTPRLVDIAGRRAVEVSLNHYGDADPARTELQPNPLPAEYFTGGTHARYGQEYTYSLSMFIPRDWQPDGSSDIVMQWHDWPDPGEAWKNPAVALSVVPKSDGAHFDVGVRADADAFTPSGGTDRYDVRQHYDLGRIDDALGKWTEWSWDIKWGYDGSGDLTLRRDGQTVLDLPGQANSFNDAKGPYFKFGLHKWAWESAADTGADSRTIYFDDILISAGPATSPPPATTTPASITVGSGPDKLALSVSQDAYQGSAQYTVSVDGRQVGGTLTASALHSAGQHDTLTVLGDWAPGSHTVAVNFLNDAWGGTAATDRNLYVDGATYNGAAVPNAAKTLVTAGPTSFGFLDPLV